jgi:hypothetical protein
VKRKQILDNGTDIHSRLLAEKKPTDTKIPLIAGSDKNYPSRRRKTYFIKARTEIN